MSTHRDKSTGHPQAEQEHRRDTGSGVLRAGIFGISDGLVSNLALVMGVAGGTDHPDAIIVAGVAGLLAGSCSMAAGEYVSMATQRESMERQIELERSHIEQFPEEEQRHLAELLEESGLDRSIAGEVARTIHERGADAADFHALFELGIVPGQMGSPWAASAISFVAFALGAAIPLIPWLVAGEALPASLLLSALALLVVGGGATRVTNRNPFIGALRQLLIGVAAAGVTYGMGVWVGGLF